jgi:hypothetical protein
MPGGGAPWRVSRSYGTRIHKEDRKRKIIVFLKMMKNNTEKVSTLA